MAESAEQMKVLHQIEKELEAISNRANSNIQFTQNTSSYISGLLSLSTYLFPKSIYGKVFSLVMNNFVTSKMLPTFGNWRVRAQMKQFEGKILKKIDEWWTALREADFNEKERITLIGELNKCLEKISKQEDLDQDIRNIVQQLMIKVLNKVVAEEISSLVKTVENFKLQDFKLLQQSLSELDIVLYKVSQKRFSLEIPLYYEIDECDMSEYQLSDKRKPYRKIYAFKDPSKDYFEEIEELRVEKHRLQACLKMYIEVNKTAAELKEACDNPKDAGTKQAELIFSSKDSSSKRILSNDSDETERELTEARSLDLLLTDNEQSYETSTGLTPKSSNCKSKAVSI